MLSVVESPLCWILQCFRLRQLWKNWKGVREVRQQRNLRRASVLSALVAAVFAVAVGSAMALIADPAWAQTTAITETGSGTASTSPPNCQNTGDRVCTTTVQGSIVGSPINNPDPTEGIVGTFTADYDNAVVTGATFTVPATDEVTLTDADGSRLFLSADGNLSGSLAPAGAPLTFDGTFTITGGTGRFAGATGNGTIAAILTGSPSGTFTASLEGTFSVPEDLDRPSPATQQQGQQQPGAAGGPVTQESEQESEAGEIDQSFEVS
jgi:hypothetical protein